MSKKLEPLGLLSVPLSSHQPNGDMCIECAHALRTCTHLCFSNMKSVGVILWENSQVTKVVICSGYLNANVIPIPKEG